MSRREDFRTLCSQAIDRSPVDARAAVQQDRRRTPQAWRDETRPAPAERNDPAACDRQGATAPHPLPAIGACPVYAPACGAARSHVPTFRGAGTGRTCSRRRRAGPCAPFQWRYQPVPACARMVHGSPAGDARSTFPGCRSSCHAGGRRTRRTARMPAGTTKAGAPRRGMHRLAHWHAYPGQGWPRLRAPPGNALGTPQE